MDEVQLIEVPACEIARRFCHGNEEAADHIRAVIRQAVSAEREACAKMAEAWGQREPHLTEEAFVPGADHGERFASRGIADAIRNQV